MTDPVLLKNLIGDKGKTLSQIKSARANMINRPVIKKDDYEQAQGVAIFRNREHRETWEYCMANKVNFESWLKEYEIVVGELPDSELFSDPKSIMVDDEGNIEASVYDRAVTIKKGKKNCKICHNTKYAYLIRGIILKNNIPANLIKTPCWCSR